MALTRHVIDLLTAADGTQTTYSDAPLRGLINAIRFVDTDLDNTLDLTITCEKSGAAVLTLTDQAGSATFAPRQPTHDTIGAASLYAAAGEPVEALIPIAGERLKVIVAQGGAAKSGALHVYVES